MPLSVRIRFALATSIATLIVLLSACEAFSPTPTPTPLPPTPTPTPEPTATERLSWFETRPDTAHWIAWAAIRRIAIEDESLGEEISGLSWVVDGVTAEEAGVLDDLSWLILDNPEIAETVMLYQWLGPEGNPMLDDRRALRAIRATADVDPDLGATLSRYPWIAAGPDRQESQALELVAELASPDYRKQTATGIGAIRVSAIAPNTPRPSESRLHPIAEIIADYSWLRDDVTRSEYQVLGAMSNLVNNSKLLSTGFHEELLSVAWLQDNVNQTEIEALERWSNLIGAAERTGTPAGRTVWEYEWAKDDATFAENSFLRTLASLTEKAGETHAEALNVVASYDWVADGITDDDSWYLPRYVPLFEHAEPQEGPALSAILGYEWIADGLAPSESYGVRQVSLLLAAGSEDDSDELATIVKYPWMGDSLDSFEASALGNLANFLRLPEADGASHRQTVLNYDWISDDVTDDELIGFRYLTDAVRLLAPEHSRSLDSVLEYEWIQDDLSERDLDSLLTLITVFDSRSIYTGDFIAALTARPWIQDNLDKSERDLLTIFGDFLARDQAPGVTIPPQLVTFSWLDDGISDLEADYVGEVLYLVREVSPIAPETTIALIENPRLESPQMFSDGIRGIRTLVQTVHTSKKVNDDLARNVARLPWLMDGITKIEGLWLAEYATFLAKFGGDNEELALSVIERPWARDGISGYEHEWMHQYRRLLEESDPTARQLAIELAELPRFHDRIDHFDASLVARLATSKLLQTPEIADLEWFRDGISDRDLVILMAFIDALARSQYQYEDLLRESHIASRTLSLPLAGDITLQVVRHTPFPDDDPTLDLMEDIALQLEEFMGVPFPLDIALILMIEPNIEAGEEPEYGVAGSLGSHIVAAPPRFNPNFHLAVFHEMAHLYWGGHTGAPAWWTEGTAGFLPSIARDALGQESLDQRERNLVGGTRRECWNLGIRTISDYYRLQQNESRVAEDRGICIYALGEIFLLDIHNLLGPEATSAAMRQLYVDAHDSGWLDKITDQRIYDAFAANVPEGKMAEFQRLFMSRHGGARVTIPELADP